MLNQWYECEMLRSETNWVENGNETSEKSEMKQKGGRERIKLDWKFEFLNFLKSG